MCLTMELYGCTKKGIDGFLMIIVLNVYNLLYILVCIECPSFVTNGENLLNKVTTSLDDNHLFNTTHHWCTCDTTPQNISLNFTESVHLTQLRMRGSLLRVKILVGDNRTVLLNINGNSVSTGITMHLHNFVASYIVSYTTNYIYIGPVATFVGAQHIFKYSNNSTMATCSYRLHGVSAV